MRRAGLRDGLTSLLVCLAVAIALVGLWQATAVGQDVSPTEVVEVPTAEPTPTPEPPPPPPTPEPPTPTPEPPTPTSFAPEPPTPTDEPESTPTPTSEPTATEPARWEPFADDFETGDLRRWDDVDNLVVQREEIFAGAYAARATSAGQEQVWARAELTIPQSEIYYRLRFQVVARGENGVTLLRVRTADGSAIVGVSIERNGTLAVSNSVTDELLRSDVSVTENVWHELQLHAAVGASGRIEVWLDGARIEDLSRAIALGTAEVGQIEVGERASDRLFDVLFDDVLVDNDPIRHDERFRAVATALATEPPASEPAATTDIADTAPATATSTATPTEGPTEAAVAELGGVAAAALVPSGPFLEQGGQVVIEAEHAHANLERDGQSWRPATDTAGYVGEGFLRAEPDNGTSIDADYAATSPELSFEVEFATAGTYQVWLRGWADSGGANSLHVGLDGRSVPTADKLSTSAVASWVWFRTTVDGPTATLSVATPGIHTINVWMREDGFRLDRVLLTTNAGFTPTGEGPTESQVGTGPSDGTNVVAAAVPGGLNGAYYDNQDLTGLVLNRTDPTIDFAWGTGSPDPAIGPDSFSVRWTGQVLADHSETYTFYTTTNDGERLWVNGQLLIDEWRNHAAVEHSGTIALQAGQWYSIRLEYFEANATAQARLSYSSPSTAKQVIPSDHLSPESGTPEAGLSGAYYDNQDLTGLALTRTDPIVNFTWGSGSPDPAIGPDSFSVRWTGQVLADHNETYTFFTTSNDGVRLWLNDQLLIDEWHNQAGVEHSGTIALQAGQWYAIRLEYYEGTGAALVQLSYSSPSVAKQVIPSDHLSPEAVGPTPTPTTATTPTAPSTATATPTATGTPTSTPTPTGTPTATATPTATGTPGGGFTPVRINFQPDTAPTPTGYTKDIGLGFSAARGFGWVTAGTSTPANLSIGTRLRTTPDDLRLRTFIHMQANNGGHNGAWEYVLPNGAYRVTVSVGDADFFNSTHTINVEGVAAISGFVPSSGEPFRSATVEVTVSNGRLTIDAIGGTNTKLNYVDIDLPGGATPTPTATATATVTPTATNTPTTTATPTGTPVGGPPFAAQGGVFVAEAEHAHANSSASGHDWIAWTDKAGFAGAAFLRAEPDNGAAINTGYATTSPQLTFQVEFPTAGTYHVWVRIWADNGDSDSLHVGLDGAEVATADRISTGARGAWAWTKSTMDGPVATLNISSPGLHTINVWMREDGVRLDRVLLTTNAGFTPTGAGPAESPRVGGPTPTPTSTPIGGGLGEWQTLAPTGSNRQEVTYVEANGKFYLAGGSTAHEVYDPVANSWTNLAPLPADIDHVQGVSVNGLIYYIGGLSQWPGPHVSTVYIYNPATNTFSQGAPMPAGRGRGAGGVAVHDGKIYYAGGLHDGAAVAWFDVYDPVADSWSPLTDMPTIRDHFHAAIVGGKLYAIGGRNTSIDATTTSNDAYNFATGQWQSGLAPLPTARGGFAAAALGNEILIIGGEGGGTTFSKVEAYNTVSNNWRTLTPMPTARHGIQAAVCNGGVYIAAGGRTQGGSNPTNIHEVFFLNGPTTCASSGGTPTPTPTPTATPPGPVSITWSTMAPILEKRSEAQGGVANGKLYVFGGYTQFSGPRIIVDRSDVYDPGTDTWSPLPDMPQPLTHGGNAVDGSDIYIAGGYVGNSDGSEVFGTTNVWRFNTVSESWTAMPSLPTARGGGALAILGRDLHYFGGNDAGRVEKGDHWVLSLDGGTNWVVKAPLPNPRTHLGAAALNGKIYAIGGQHGAETSAVTLADVHAYDPVADTWTPVASVPLPLSHVSASTFVVGDQIVVVGGEKAYSQHLADVRAYHPASNSWVSWTPLPATRHSGVGGLVGNTIYFSTGELSTTTYRGVLGGGGSTPTPTPTPTPTSTPTSGPEIELTNLDVVPYADRLVFSRIGTLASPPTTHGVHNRATLRITNTGTAPLSVTALTISGPWIITPAVSLPATIPPGGQLNVTIEFRAETGDMHTGTLTIASNDADESSTVVQLAGFWQNVPEGGQEPDLVELIDLFGYETTIVGPGQQLNQSGLVTTVGEEILAPYWQRADASQPVGVYQLAAYHSTAIAGIIHWFPKGSTTTTLILDSATNDRQTVLPRKSGSSTLLAQATFTPTSTLFGFRLDGEWSDPTLNIQSVDQSKGCPGPCGHHVRVWPARDRSGTVIPNTYLVGFDYQSINYDYQDTLYLITNLQPEETGGTPTPTPTPIPGSVNVNFQPDSAPAPSGYIKDTGLAFSASRGFGWVRQDSLSNPTATPLNLSPNTRDRNRPGVDQRIDTIIHMQYPPPGDGTSVTTPGAWEYVLANGTYSVTVSVGDQPSAGGYGSLHTINVEDVPAIVGFQPNAAQEYRVATVTVTVADGRLTVDAIGGTNTKLNYVEIVPIGPGENPQATGSSPAYGATGVLRNSAVNVDVSLPNVGEGVDPVTLTSANVYLYVTKTGLLVPGTTNTTGGGDAIVFQSADLLAANTNYTFRGTVGVTDTSGASFLPFTITFTTGTEPSDLNPPATFSKTSVYEGGAISTVAIDPAGTHLYAALLDGSIHRWEIDDRTGLLSNEEVYAGLAGRAIIGLAFDPGDPNVLWVSHNAALFPQPAPDFSGEIAKLTIGGAGFSVSLQPYIVGLPRSAKDHLTNSLTFHNGMLYVTQGSNSAMGAPDAAWDQRPERRLNAAVLQIDPTLTSGLPIDVRTENGGSYDPAAPGASVTIFVTGVRNAYDLVWHSNGLLYLPTNGSAAGGNTPASPSGVTPVVPALNNVRTQNDFLFVASGAGGGYYGHPNPLHGEYAMNGSNPSSGADPAEVVQVMSGGQLIHEGYPVGIAPDVNYQFFAWDFGRNRSPNGIIEYQSATFDGVLQGKLLVVEYSGGDDILILTPGSGGSISSAEVLGVPDGLTNPLDLVENTTNGNIYVVELITISSGGASGRISVLRPA